VTSGGDPGSAARGRWAIRELSGGRSVGKSARPDATGRHPSIGRRRRASEPCKQPRNQHGSAPGQRIRQSPDRPCSRTCSMRLGRAGRAIDFCRLAQAAATARRQRDRPCAFRDQCADVRVSRHGKAWGPSVSTDQDGSRRGHAEAGTGETGRVVRTGRRTGLWSVACSISLLCIRRGDWTANGALGCTGGVCPIRDFEAAAERAEEGWWV
jgi:hypothetical protein